MYKEFHSNYISNDYNYHKTPPFKGKYFVLNYGSPIQDGGPVLPNSSIVQEREIIIEAKDIYNAIRASKLIFASLIVIDSCVLMIDEIPVVTPIMDNKRDKEDISREKFFITDKINDFKRQNIPLACMIACKVSFKKSYSYALFKYKLGCSLHSNDIVDLDPMHSPYYKSSPFVDDKIRMGQAIILFYSVIEELGLEIRASHEKQSFINKEWNPEVKEELEMRLKKSDINIDDESYWNLRSTPTKIERNLRKQKKLSLLDKAQWAYGYTRDSKIKVIDAILLTSWMRSSVVSHKLSKSNALINSISIYDVANANHLARRLLLETLGYWDYFYKLYLRI